jgi:hypothetical protein
MRLLERFERQAAAATFLDFRPTLFFGVPTIYTRLLDIPKTTRERSAARCVYSYPALLRSPRKSSRSSAPVSATTSWSVTA